MKSLEELSREELVEALKDTRAALAEAREAVESERRLHDLQVHQVELELQNRELREAQAALEASRRRYAELYDLAPVAYCTLEKDGRIREANLAATAYFGVDRSSLVGRPLAALVEADDRPVLRNHLRRCVADRARVTVELRLALPALGPTPFQLVSTPIVGGADAAVTACKTAFTDISQLKLVEQRLLLLARASALLSRSFALGENLAAVVDALVPGAADLCFIDLFDEPEREVTRVAVSVADPAQVAVAEALKRPPAPRSTATEPLLAVDEPGAALSPLIGDGAQREALIDACAARSVMVVPLVVHGRHVGVLCMVMAGSGRRHGPADLAFATDLAGRAATAVEAARLYREAERSRRSRQELLSVVSHELETPLAGIARSAELLLEASPPDDRRNGRTHVERIKRGLAHVQALLNDLNDLPGLESGHLPVDPKPTAVAPLLREAADLLAPLAAGKRLSLTPAADEALVALCDRGRVMQVLANLIGNAIKFTPEGGAVTVSAEHPSGERQLRFCVRDTGPGLPKAVLLNLFQRTFKGRAGENGDRGLGLHIARDIVESLGGTIWVESQAREGTSFLFTLPVAPFAALEQRARHAGEAGVPMPAVAGAGEGAGRARRS